MKWFLFLFIFCLLGCDDFDERSVVRVNMDEWRGTGFWYSENIVMTSAHIANSGTEGIFVEYLDEDYNVQIDYPLDIYANFEEDKMFLVMNYSGFPVCFKKAPISSLVQLWYWTEDSPSNIQGLVYWDWNGKYWVNAPSRDGYSGGPATRNGCVIGLINGITSINTTVLLKLEEN